MGGQFGGGPQGGQVSSIVQAARRNNEAMQRRQFGDNGGRQPDPMGHFHEGLYLRDPVQAYKEVLQMKPTQDRAQDRQRNLELEELDEIKGMTYTGMRCIEERVRDFEGLKERRKNQVKHLLEQEKRLKELQGALDKVVADQQKSVHLRVERMREEYMEERSNFIRIVAKLELLKGPHMRTRNGHKETSLTPDEENFRDNLAQMRAQLAQPNQFNARLESLDKLQYLERTPQEVKWESFTEEDKRRIVQFLNYQKSALEILTQDVRSKEQHLEVMQKYWNEISNSYGTHSGHTNAAVTQF